MLTTSSAEGETGHAAALAVDPPLSERLRSLTREEHESIERNLRLRRLTAPDLGVDEYVTILARLGLFFLPVEAIVRRWSHVFPDALDIDARLAKAALLRRDIAALAPGFDWETTAPAPGSFPALSTPGEAWGCLYVVEGATLGGQILARHLGQQLGLTPDHGIAFYSSYGSQTGARWKTFKLLLNASARDGLDDDEIVAGAKATFHAMDSWMAGKP